jgi:low molecular weight phosphotyrosine protein phosphatase
MGEAVLRDVAAKRGITITIDSCGTSNYHLEEDPDER